MVKKPHRLGLAYSTISDLKEGFKDGYPAINILKVAREHSRRSTKMAKGLL